MSDGTRNGMMTSKHARIDDATIYLKEFAMKETNQKENNKKKVTSKQVVAMVGVILLVLMYIVTLVVAIVDTSASGKYFAVCMACTLIIPIIIWIYSWMYGRYSGKKVIGDPEITDASGEE